MKSLLKDRRVFYAALFLLCTLIFWKNIIGTSSEYQFRTYRDGSEALVLGKIFADVHGVPTGKANLGFVERDKITNGADVLAVYNRIDHPDAIVPAPVTDPNWIGGVARAQPAIIIGRAEAEQLGYASNEVRPGQALHFADGQTRTVTSVSADSEYLTVTFDGAPLDGRTVGYPKEAGMWTSSDFKFSPYVSQYGPQGALFSRLYRSVPGFDSVSALQLFAAAACAIVLVLLAREYRISISTGFAIIFLLSMVGSPWIVAKARDLYWVAFLWFLPALVAMWLYRRIASRPVCLALYFVAVLLKALAGYEYLSTVVLLSMAAFFVDPWMPVPRYGKRRALKIVAALGTLSVVAFVVALLMQSEIRGQTIMQGLELTFRKDALKYNDLSHVAHVASRGLDMSMPSLLAEYVFQWRTPLLFWGSQPYAFATLIVLCAASLAYQFAVRAEGRKRDAALVVAMLLPALSWLLLMKGHSVVHTHLNYVLWYIGAVPALLFVTLRPATIIVRKMFASDAPTHFRYLESNDVRRILPNHRKR
ncbi:hypothetical protein BYI23_B004850 [Burkholderia sp. YI23]|nr:hypothetical protein BYI23_B004850 [Burkholderia sp. YI23]